MSNVIIKRQCLAISPTGVKTDTYVGLERPTKGDQPHWFCKLDFGKLDFPERMAIGIDEWQAFQLGMRMMYIELDFKMLTGWKFYWFNQSTDNLEELWPYEEKNSSNVQ